MIEIFVALVVVGFTVKVTDDLIDLFKKPKWSFMPALFYGGLSAWAVINMPLLAPLAIGIVLAIIFSRKINHFGHLVGVIAFAFPIAMRVREVSFALTLVFAAAAIVDEIGNDLSDKNRLRRAWKQFFRYRLLLEATALVVSAYTGRWEFLAAIVAFDAGYIIAEKISGKAIEASQ